jgi:DNA-binding Lrp family transcriptional regulator
MQKADFLTSLIDAKRAKILRLLVLNDRERFFAADLAKRSGLSVPALLKELNALEMMGIAVKINGEGSNAAQRKKNTTYAFNEKGKYANALSAFVHAVTPETFNDVERALRGAGKMNAIVLSGVFIGDMRRPADLLLVADSVNEKRLEKVLRGFEPKYGREIRYTIFSTPEFRYRMTINDKLVRDTLDYPHRLLLNKNNLI